MSDYIKKNEVMKMLTQVDLRYGDIADEKANLSKMPTISETEIIRKAFERVLEYLNEKLINADLECASWKNKSSALFRCADSKRIAYAEAIEIVKEECGISERD